MTSFLVRTMYLPRKQAETIIISSMEMMNTAFANAEIVTSVMFADISAPGMSESRPFHIRIQSFLQRLQIAAAYGKRHLILAQLHYDITFGELLNFR